MAIYVQSMSASTAGGGIKVFIDTELWELVTTGVDDFYKPLAERKALRDIFREWLHDPEDYYTDGFSLANLVLESIHEQKIPKHLLALIHKVLESQRA